MRLAVEQVEVHPLAVSSHGVERRCALLVLHADGLTGVGEAPAGADLAAVCSELLDGRPRCAAARAAWASAELDLAGRLAGRPAADLLGGVRRSRVRRAHPVAARAPAAVAREVEAASAGGVASFELRAECGGGPLDLERLGAARWASGCAAVLRLDLAGALAAGSAARVLHSLAAFRLELAVQPLPAGSAPDDWRRLASSGRPPLAAAASERAGAEALAASGVALVIDPAAAGGPAAACALAGAAAGAVLLRAACVTPVGLAAALHVAAALRVEPLACALGAPCWPGGPDLDAGGPWLTLPAGPGLGVGLDAGAVARYRLDR